MTKQSLAVRPISGESNITPAERRVLAIFRQFLMTPGRMLCFCGNELDTWGGTLAEMSSKGFLVAERFHGAFSLTKAGFARMRHCCASR
jgi:hypothetical protein